MSTMVPWPGPPETAPSWWEDAWEEVFRRFGAISTGNVRRKEA